MVPGKSLTGRQGTFTTGVPSLGEPTALERSSMDLKGSILIVGDQSGWQSLSPILQRVGCDCEWVGTGGEALERARNRLFDLAIVDVELSEASDVNLLAALRRLNPDLVIITAASPCSLGKALRALETRASASATRPFGTDEGVATVGEEFEMQRLTAESQRSYRTAQREVTERKRVEQALCESEERYSSLFERVPIGLYRTTPTGDIVDANPALVEMLRYPDLRSLLAVNVAELYAHARDRRQELDLLEQEGIVLDHAIQLRRLDGVVIWARDTCRAVQDSDGKVLFYDGSLEDISERRRAEDALRESEAKWRSLVENAPDIIFTVDRDGKILFMNRAPKDLGGAELQRMTVYDCVAPEHHELTRRSLEHVFRTGESVSYEVVGRGHRDTLSWYSTHLGPVGHGDGINSAIMLTRDITDQKRLEERLRQAQKMEAVGRLAGGIAHDFNNLLTVINGYSQMAIGTLPPTVPERQDVEQIYQAGLRAADLTRRLLAFSRRQAAEVQVLSLNELLNGVNQIIRRIIGEDIRLDIRLAPDLGCVRADPAQLEQLMINLAANARDAMPTGGTLTIVTGNTELDESYASTYLEAAPGRYVLLAVHDTGTGIDDQIKEHLFEPFFTTKEVGKGTGLGLAMVYGIVAQVGGSVDVTSRPGQGTTFRIYLPRVDGAVESPPTVTQPVIQRGSETILVVEDDDQVRRVIVRQLDQLGYAVLDVPNGEDALRLCRNLNGPIDLVLADLITPEMSGPEFVERLRATHRDFRVLYMSGYAEGATAYHRALKPGAVLLQKPFAMEALAQKIREMLG